jgi:hypothetical protein
MMVSYAMLPQTRIDMGIGRRGGKSGNDTSEEALTCPRRAVPEA